MGRAIGLLAFLTCLFCFVTVANAEDASITVTGAHANPTLLGVTTGVVYFTLSNHGATPDALTGAATPAAESAELHEDVMTGDVMSMKKIDTLPLPPGAAVTLAQGKYHLMLTGVKSPLKPGDTVPLTLTFEKHAPIEIDVPVIKPVKTPVPSSMPPGMHMDMLFESPKQSDANLS